MTQESMVKQAMAVLSGRDYQREVDQLKIQLQECQDLRDRRDGDSQDKQSEDTALLDWLNNQFRDVLSRIGAGADVRSLIRNRMRGTPSANTRPSGTTPAGVAESTGNIWDRLEEIVGKLNELTAAD